METKAKMVPRIEAGQVYYVTKSWVIPGFESHSIEADITLNIISVDDSLYGTIFTSCPPKLSDIGLPLDDDGNIKWSPGYLKDLVKEGYLSLMKGIAVKYTLTKHKEPEHNGSNTICYWCKQPTEPLFGMLRICRACGK